MDRKKVNVVAHAEFHLTSGVENTQEFRAHMWECLSKLTVKQIRMLVKEDGTLTHLANNYYNNCCASYNGK
jgi:hypothetical protein